jgi:YidC/Oxa1 family membrane protein insertase
MDRNSIIGLGLIGAILIGYSIWSAPSEKELAKVKHQRDSIELVQAKAKAEQATAQKLHTTANTAAKTIATGNDSSSTAQQTALYGTFASAANGKKEYYTIENELLKITISSKGGKITSAVLKKFKTYDGKPVQLFNGDSTLMDLSFAAQNKAISTSELYFTAVGSSFNVTGTNSQTLAMRLPAGDGKYIEYLYTLIGNSYDVGFTMNTVGLNDVITGNNNSLLLSFATDASRHEKNIDIERSSTTVYYQDSEKEVNNLSETKDSEESLKSKVKWVAFKQQYFSTVFIANDNFENASKIKSTLSLNSNTKLKRLSADFAIPYTHKPNESFGMRIYFGPNHYKTLTTYDLNLEKLIPLGWGIFGWVNKGIVIPLFNFLDSFSLNYGLIILILTIIIKICLLPFTFKAYQSQAKMKLLKPEIDEITAKNGGDAMKSQQETMSLYKRAGVNPFGGCLPMLFQMPVLIALFRFFPASIELRQQSFLWADDLSTYDSIYNLGFNIPFYGDHISLFTLLMTVSTILYTRMNSQFTGSNAQQMKIISYMMPVIFLGVFNNYAAGLSYYYFLANMFTFGQQYLFKAFVNEEALHAKLQENKKKPTQKSKLQERLETMAKQKANQQKKIK